jgi:hypothetical protein
MDLLQVLSGGARCMTALTVGCGTPSRSAARRTCCSSKTATAMASSGLSDATIQYLDQTHQKVYWTDQCRTGIVTLTPNPRLA